MWALSVICWVHAWLVVIVGQCINCLSTAGSFLYLDDMWALFSLLGRACCYLPNACMVSGDRGAWPRFPLLSLTCVSFFWFQTGGGFSSASCLGYFFNPWKTIIFGWVPLRCFLLGVEFNLGHWSYLIVGLRSNSTPTSISGSRNMEGCFRQEKKIA